MLFRSGEVALPPGTWKATGQIVLQDGVTLSGAGMDKTVLDCTTTTASTAHVLGQGSIAALANQFTTNIPANGRAIKFSASPGVTTGDLLLLYNSADYSFSGARSYYRAGEFARVSKCFGTTTNGSNQLTSVSHASSFTTGQAVAGTGIPGGTTVVSVSGSTITMSSNATATGTLVEVTSPNAVFVERSIYGAYTAGATTTIYKVTPIRTGISGVKMNFSTAAGLTGIRIDYGNKVVMRDLDLSGTNNSHLTFSRCFEADAERVRVDDYNSAEAGLNYGIVVGNSQKVNVRDCYLSTFRHGLATGGGSETGMVPVRELMVEGCTAVCKGNVYALNIHGNAEYCTFRDNYALGGLTAAGDHIDIIDNVVTSMQDAGSAMNIGEMVGTSFRVEGNKVVAKGNYTTSLIQAVDSAFAYVTRGGNFRIANNVLDADNYVHTSSMTAIAVANTFVDVDSSLEILNNRVRTPGNSMPVQKIGIIATGDGTYGFRRVFIKGNQLQGCGIRVDKTASRVIDLENNYVEDPNFYGIDVLPYTTAYASQQDEQTITARGNTVNKPAYGGLVLRGDFDGSKTTVVCENNTSVNTNQYGSTGSSSTDSSVFVSKAKRAFVRGNVFGKDAADTGSQLRTLALSNITDLYEARNVNIGTLSNNVTSVTNQYGDFTGLAKNVVTYGTAAPTVGTWRKGDLVYNTAASAGDPLGWYCVTAGTPGTWKELAPVSL